MRTFEEYVEQGKLDELAAFTGAAGPKELKPFFMSSHGKTFFKMVQNKKLKDALNIAISDLGQKLGHSALEFTLKYLSGVK